MNLLMQNFFSFGMYHLFKTVGWHRVDKDDKHWNASVKMQIHLSGALFRMIQYTAFWYTFPSGSVRYLSWFGKLSLLASLMSASLHVVLPSPAFLNEPPRRSRPSRRREWS